MHWVMVTVAVMYRVLVVVLCATADKALAASTASEGACMLTVIA